MAIDPRIEELAQLAGLTRVGIFFQEMGSGKGFGYHAGDRFHAASTMKVPIMMEAFRQNREGTFDLDGTLLVQNEFKSLLDGSPYELDSENDSDPALYERIGQPVPTRELVERMITRSSNLATNLLIDQLHAESVGRMLAGIGCPGMRVLRGVEDDRAYRAGLSNSTTAEALGRIMLEIGEGSSFPESERREMKEILLRQEHRHGIAAGVPGGSQVASKSGSFTGTFHDAAIVEVDSDNRFVLVVLTEGQDEGDAAPFVAKMARICADHEFG